eukprot:m.359552 g.359552  ORF g.359552 m.359552 type:complete len:343 (+) comp18612_c0_seq1:236-1264(+)
MATRWAFIAEWYDSRAELTRPYSLLVYPDSKEVEMIDNKMRKIFLRRTQADIDINTIFVGTRVNLLGRQLYIADYADDITRKTLSRSTEQGFAILPDSVASELSSLFKSLQSNNAKISYMKMAFIDAAQAATLRQCPGLEQLAGGPSLCMGIVGAGASALATTLASRNGGFSAPDETAAIRCLETVQRARLPSTATLDGALCLIKPHAMPNASGILAMIEAGGFRITSVHSFIMDTANAEEFLEVYKGVVPEYAAMVGELSSGLSLAVEVTKGGLTHPELPQQFRALAGPPDPEIARHLRPNTIRAKFGDSKVKNAVHVTDVPEDATVEVEYIFSFLPEASA